MSGTVAARLFKMLPPRMPLTEKYRLIENLWSHVGPRSRNTLRIGLDTSVEQILEAVRKHIEDVVVRYKIPKNLERRFEWLAAGDSHAKQDLLNHLLHMEKALVEQGARLQLPVMLSHLRGDQGRRTHHLSQILRIGNHELELLLEKGATGVSAVSPQTIYTQTKEAARSLSWMWWVVAGIAVLLLLISANRSNPPVQVKHQPVDPAISRPKALPPSSSQQREPLYVPPVAGGPLRESDPWSSVQPPNPTGPSSSLSTPSMREKPDDFPAPLALPGPTVRAAEEKVDSTSAPTLPTPQIELEKIEDAKRVQQRLIELGFLFGVADGIWGPRSRQALRNFWGAQGMESNDSWDSQVQERLFSTSAMPSPVGANTLDNGFVGGWGVDANQCRQGPLTITTQKAEAFGAICEFASIKRESSNEWRAQATCTNEGKRWQANIRLTTVGNKLTWSSERGTTSYTRCSG